MGVVALIVIVLAALGLRLYALDWDDGRDLHPDELYVAKDVLIQRIFVTWPPQLGNLLDPERSGLNPRSADPTTGQLREYPYGALPLLITDTAATALGWITGENWNASDRAYLVGRFLSALLDTLTVIVVYLIGARVVSARIGLLAALFAALAPISIQLAHFFTTDAWLTCFVALTLYTSTRAAESGSGRWFAATGLWFGLAMATKGSVFALAGLIGAAIVYDMWRRWRDDPLLSAALFAVPKQVAVSTVAALIGFALFEPYAFVRPEIYVQSLRTQAAIAGGTFDIPFSRVFIGTMPVVYQLEQFVRWGFGPMAGFLALAGVFVLARRFWRIPSAGQWILLCWLLGYGLVISIAETKFLRYLSPLMPALALTAALALAALADAIRTRFGHRFAIGVVSVLLVGAGLWTAAFLNVYAAEHPRLAASRWIYDNVPAGSTLSWEYWDDRLPKPLGPGLNEEDLQYQFLSIDLYADRPPAEAAAELYDTLDELDYIVMSSDRIAAAIPRLPWRYPVQIRFLDLLHSGQLGFSQVAQFHVTPRLGPIELDDRGADESFINYDHPRVTILAKDRLVSRVDYDRLMSWALDRPWSATRQADRPSLLLDQPVGDLPVVDDSRWSADLTDNSLAALAVWIALLVVFQVVGWPLAAFLFDRFGDAGWGVARLLVLLISGYVVWLGASLRWIEFRAIWAWVAVIALGIAAWTLHHRRPVQLTVRQRQTRIGAELVFWIVFAVFLLFRYLNPDGWHPIWGGEKPMEFAHLNATLRSAHFPPYDPWYADGYINYYYYGLYLIAFCLKLTGIPTEIGFNLAQPTVIALLASAGYSVAATLGRDLSRQARLAVPAGLLGVVLLLTIGNLTSLGRLLSTGQQDFGSYGDWVWAGSRAIQDTITEFPFFTALYADLHAHVVALPITVLTIGLAYAVARDRPTPVQRRTPAFRLTQAVRFTVLALVLGSLFPTNAWDVPAYAALAVVAIWMGFGGIADWRARTTWSTATSLLVGLGAYLFYRPFHEHYVALFGSLGMVRAPTRLTEATSHIGGPLAIAVLGLLLLSLPRRTASPWPVNQPAVAVVLLTLGLLVANLADRVQPLLADSLFAVLLVAIAAISLVVIWTEAKSLRRYSLRWWMLVTVVAAVFLLGIGALGFGQPVLAGYLFVIGLAFARWLSGVSVASRFVALLVLAAASIGTGTEMVFVADDLIDLAVYRMNTIFKFYNQIWILLAIAGAALLTRMVVDSRWFRPPPDRPRPESRPAGIAARTGWARAGLIVATVLIGGSFLYPLLATLPRLSQRFEPGLGSGTLNALDWMDTGTLDVIGGNEPGVLSFEGDHAAIDWLNRNVDGSPVIAEASIGPYRCNGSRISIGTGLPTIIGWERHQQQQRYRELLPERVADVRTLYTSSDPAEKEAILRKYNVAFVVVGDIEREYIVPNGNDCQATESPAGVEAFDAMVGSTLEPVFTGNDTVIYRVLLVNQQAVSNPVETGQ